MRITLNPQEIIVPSGGYNESDDMHCKGCGRWVAFFQDHNLLQCLQSIREDHEKAIADLQKQLDSLDERKLE